MKLPVIQPGEVVYEPPEEFEALLDWVGIGLANLETIEDEHLREQIFALLQGIDMLHRQGLDRMLRLVTTLGGRGLTERVIQDAVVKTLLDLYDLPEYQESEPMVKPKVLIAGIGNDLCRDDGFGIVTLARLVEAGVPDEVRLYESGIAGIGLVQELMDGYEAVIFVDAMDRGGEPGTLYLLETDVPDVSDENRDQFLADMHFVVPSTALLLGKALNVLPPRIFILGCQPAEYGLGLGLSAPVEAAVDEALARILELTATLLKDESHVPIYSA